MHGRRVLWYSCGPTVYDASHMGHARLAVFLCGPAYFLATPTSVGRTSPLTFSVE